ncbi:MAG: VOC family protein [Armatimonadota bacterium]
MITHIGHAAFRVRDLDAALAFYCGKLGLTEAFRLYHDSGEVWIVYLKINPNTFIELFPDTNLERHAVSGSYQHLCLLVDDMGATLKDLRSRGLDIQGEPSMGKDGNLQYWLTDPDGNRIELMQIMPGSLQAGGG